MNITTVLVTRHSDELEKAVANEINQKYDGATSNRNDIEGMLANQQEIPNSGIRTE